MMSQWLFFYVLAILSVLVVVNLLSHNLQLLSALAFLLDQNRSTKI